MPPRKRAGNAVEQGAVVAPAAVGVVPANSLRLAPAEPAGQQPSTRSIAVPCPDVDRCIREQPTKDAASAVTTEVMPWVTDELTRRLVRGDFDEALPAAARAEATTITELKPLPIATVKTGALKSFKHPWNDEAAAHSLETTGMHEASCSLFSLSAEVPPSKDLLIIAGLRCTTWTEMDDLTQRFQMAAVVTDDSNVQRITFPATVPVAVERKEDLKRGKPLLRGHAYVWAWYVEMCRALAASQDIRGDANDGNAPATSARRAASTKVLALLQCALTVSVHVRCGLSRSKMATWSIHLSEASKHGATQTDPLVVFAEKAWLALGKDAAISQAKRTILLKDMEITFNNGTMNKVLVGAISDLNDPQKWNERCSDILTDIDRDFGRAVLSDGYAKVAKIIHLCNREALASSQSTVELVAYVLGYLWTGFKAGTLKPKKLNMDVLDNNTTKGKERPGEILMALARREIVTNLISSWAEDMKHLAGLKTLEKDLRAAVAVFQDYITLFEAISDIEKGGEDAADAANADAGAEAPQGKQQTFEAFLETLETKPGKQAANCMFDIMSGAEDDHIAAQITIGSPLASSQWVCADSKIQGLRELHRLLNAHKNTVSSEVAPPDMANRTLKRLHSDALPEEQEDAMVDLQKERSAVWRQAQDQRRKLVQVVYARGTQFQAPVDAAAKRFDVTFTPGAAHRMFFFGADTNWEPEEKPWSTPAAWSVDCAAKVAYMLAQQGPSDILVFSDGRSRAVRHELEKIWEKLRHCVEIWVVYVPSPRMGRKVSLASDTRETLFISLPVARTSWPVADRDTCNASGETTTHASTYTGVKPLAWAAMPRLFDADKRAILGHDVQKPKAKFFDTSVGQPLMWNERRTHQLWTRVLKDLKVKLAVDMSPCSGQLARACLDTATYCIVMARNAEHCSWLQNVVDRYATLTVSRTGSFLYEADLAAQVKEMFQDVLDQLNEQDALEDKEPEEDIEGEGP